MFSQKMSVQVCFVQRSQPISPQKRSIFWSKLHSRTLACWKTRVTQSTYILISIRLYGIIDGASLKEKRICGVSCPLLYPLALGQGCVLIATLLSKSCQNLQSSQHGVSRGLYTVNIPVSSTAIMFCFLAFSNSSSWYSLGSVIMTLESCFAMRLRTESVSSLALSKVTCSSSFVVCSARFDTL